jgi:hypothetical protein
MFDLIDDRSALDETFTEINLITSLLRRPPSS